MKVPSPTELAARQAPLAASAPAKPTSAQAAEKKAAQEFEAIFLRKMLSCLEKSTKIDGSNSLSSSADAYSSMIVGALADAVAAAGGIGLGQSMLRSIEGRAGPHETPSPTDKNSKSDSPIQGSGTRTVQGLRKGDE